MDSPNKDEILNNFIAVTQCPNEEARRYLEAAQWNPETAMEIFFDDGSSPRGDRAATNDIQPSRTSANPNVPAVSGGATSYDSDDEGGIQAAISESLRNKGATAKPTPSRFGTVGGLQKDEDSSDDEGQAFYAGGSERSGQQILGPRKPKDPESKITKIFEAARRQGATEADEEENTSSQRKKDKAFTGVGYTLGDFSTPAQTMGRTGAPEAAAAPERAEQVPLRFFANGFTVGDGELRRFEDNKEFMSYIKRGEVPPELRSLTAGGRQIEVRLEDHRTEDYKPLPPQFKAFGGVGHMLGSPTPNVTASTTTTRSMTTASSTTSGPADVSALEKLAEKQLKSAGSSTTIRLRLPDISKPLCIAIDLNRTLIDVRRFLNENVPSLQSNQFQFIEPPSTKINPEDEKKTISEAKLTNATLAVRRNS